MISKPLRLLIPQWQGGNHPPHSLAEHLLWDAIYIPSALTSMPISDA